MRKLLTLIIAPFLLFTGLQAQTITQQEADALVLEKMSGETRPYSIYAKEDIQPAGTVLTTSAGEVMVFEYEHWLYYISFTDNSQDNCYFVVKESNGSLLEVNVKDDKGLGNLESWRYVYAQSLQGTIWKLLGVVDEEAGSLIELGPKNAGYEYKYFLNFITNDSLTGRGYYSLLVGNCEIDYLTNNINILLWRRIHFGHTCESCDENIYLELLNKVSYFSIQSNNLLLYFDEQKYLLFNNVVNNPEIHFEESILANDQYQWLMPNTHAYQMWVINSYEELENHIVNNGNYPEIDFSIHSLLLVRILGTEGELFSKKFEQIALNTFFLTIEYHFGNVQHPQEHRCALVVKKIGNSNTTKLIVIGFGHIY